MYLSCQIVISGLRIQELRSKKNVLYRGPVNKLRLGRSCWLLATPLVVCTTGGQPQGCFGLTPFPPTPLRNSSIVSCPTFLRHLASMFPLPCSSTLSLRISSKSLLGGYGKFSEPHNFQPIRRTTEILVVTRHQYRISTLVPQTAFHLETSGGMAKWQLFSQGTQLLKLIWWENHTKKRH